MRVLLRPVVWSARRRVVPHSAGAMRCAVGAGGRRRSCGGAVTRTALTWLVAWVWDLTAESGVSFRMRIIST